MSDDMTGGLAPAEGFSIPAPEDLAGTSPSCHDLHITTQFIPRTRLFDLPYGLVVRCTRVTGWQLWQSATHPGDWTLLAGEYEGPELWLVLDVAGHVILDSRRQESEEDSGERD